MRYVFGIAFLFVSSVSFSQENDELTTYSFTEFMQMIEDEQDSVFILKNACISLNSQTDSKFKSDSYIANKVSKEPIEHEIDKHVFLDNVQFCDNHKLFRTDEYSVLKNIHFKKSLKIHNVYNIVLANNIIEGSFRFTSDGKVYNKGESFSVFSGNVFNGNTTFMSTDNSSFIGNQIGLELRYNTINLNFDERFLFNINHSLFYNCSLVDNQFNGPGRVLLLFEQPTELDIERNEFNIPLMNFKININDETLDRLKCVSNKFKCEINLSFTNPVPSADIEWEQFENKLISRSGFDYYMEDAAKGMSQKETEAFFHDAHKMIQPYLSKYRIHHNPTYKAEMELRGTFYNYYKSKFDKESSNAVYIELKNLETERLAYLYASKPTFNGYFKWKMNQFLKVFSDYGTNPTKSIIFSIYVILIFGIVYLFFPNSWDSHGKNRIIHRYGFFMKYMVKDAGIHEVYLEEKQQEFAEYKAFSAVITESKNKVPRFFTTTSLLLLKWAKSGSVFSSFLLQRIDIMKGKWAELTKGRRLWKSILLIFIFTIAVIYDIFIKMLNALMLSINTFTTLGFGEIPIRGLPRYLAIMQGFIGWFLLTIFSVSLISQLME